MLPCVLVRLRFSYLYILVATATKFEMNSLLITLVLPHFDHWFIAYAPLDQAIVFLNDVSTVKLTHMLFYAF